MEKLLLQPEEIRKSLSKNLLKVQKPGRYIGGEFNQNKKEWDSVQIHFALAFPDIYDIGLPNLGLSILYNEINKRSDCLAERVYSPWADMEQVMRENEIPSYTLESNHAIKDFDFLGITLPYETLYTNALNLLDLGNIPLFSKDRKENDPIIIAGGNSTFNPEPMAAFIDLFVIGDGEEIIHEIIDTYKNWKSLNDSRSTLFIKLSMCQGIYVPSFYEANYDDNDKFLSLNKNNEESSLPIIKSLVTSLPPPPTQFIVPNIDIIHNRVAIEIMRGCTRGCRFCQAGMINRPVRERTIEQIIESLREAIKLTGFEEISLLSLSSSDFTNIGELIDRIKKEFCENQVSISMPSLRIDTLSVELMDKLSGVRHGSFTLAPEAASEQMRNRINKPISSENLINVSREIFKHKWPSIKLYFMIGLPNETNEDLQAIVDLTRDVWQIGKYELGRRVNLNISINTFIPKPHTPFQWMSLVSQDDLKEKQAFLMSNLRAPGIRLSWSDYQMTLLESWLSRGDRRISTVIYNAWKSGAKFDAWHEMFNFDAWINAFNKSSIDPYIFSSRPREISDSLPWDHIQTGVNKEFLIDEYLKSASSRTTPYCRSECSFCGIQTNFPVKCLTNIRN